MISFVALPRRFFLNRMIFVTLASFVLLACAGNEAKQSEQAATPQIPTPSPIPTRQTVVLETTSEPKESPQTELASLSDADSSINQTIEQSELPSYMRHDWKTDFSKHSVSYDEIIPAGAPRDGIKPVDAPKFQEVADAADYMKDDEPVISVDVSGDARAYPLSILIRHEIVNDEVGGVPVAVTYCPLCNSGIVFDRRVDGDVLDFGVTGNLRLSDLLMWDRQTESWWQQITGEAIIGELTGKTLTFIPASMVTWEEFRKAFPDGKLLSRDTGFDIDYDSPAYAGYDSPWSYPSLLKQAPDVRMPSLERVVGVTVGGQAVAYPFGYLDENPIVNDSINKTDIVIFFASDTLSPFPGADNTENRTAGSAAVYSPLVSDTKLTFDLQDGTITDNETGSTWNMLGRAVEGPLDGTQLSPVLHGNHFWFAWAAFNPDTVIRDDVPSRFP